MQWVDAALTTTTPAPFGDAPFRRALHLLRHGHLPSELRWTLGAVAGRGPSTAALARWALAGAALSPQRAALAEDLIRSWPGRISDVDNLVTLTDDEIYVTVRRSVDVRYADRGTAVGDGSAAVGPAAISACLAPDGLTGLSRANANLFLCTLYEHLGPDRRMRLPRRHLVRLASEGAPTWPALACLLTVDATPSLVDISSLPAWAAVASVILAVGAKPPRDVPSALTIGSDNLRVYVLLDDGYWDLGDTASRHDEATVRARRSAVAERALTELGDGSPLDPLLRQLRRRLVRPSRR